MWWEDKVRENCWRWAGEKMNDYSSFLPLPSGSIHVCPGWFGLQRDENRNDIKLICFLGIILKSSVSWQYANKRYYPSFEQDKQNMCHLEMCCFVA